jgi:hypothetical protein
MVKKKDEDKGMRPATTPENREQQLIALAVNLAEKQLRDGTASPSVINHYLKMASRREVLERDILEKQSKLIDVKAKNIEKEKEQEEMAKAALQAMKNYTSGSNNEKL